MNLSGVSKDKIIHVDYRHRKNPFAFSSFSLNDFQFYRMLQGTSHPGCGMKASHPQSELQPFEHHDRNSSHKKPKGRANKAFLQRGLDKNR